MILLIFILIPRIIHAAGNEQQTTVNVQQAPFQYIISHTLNNQNVEEFIASMYDEQQMQSHSTLLLFVYGVDCQHSARVDPEWTRLEQRILRHEVGFTANTRIAKYNLQNLRLAVLDGSHNDLARKRLNVKTYPTFYVFQGGKMHEYGDRNRGVEKWAQFVMQDIHSLRPLYYLPNGNDSYYIYLAYNSILQFLTRCTEKNLGLVWMGVLLVIWISGLFIQCLKK